MSPHPYTSTPRHRHRHHHTLTRAPQVIGAQSLRFYRELFRRLHTTANLRSLVWDGLDVVWLSSDERVSDVHAQTSWHAGFADAALELGLPMRVDMSLPSDTLASVLYGAHTVGRCMPDAVPNDQGAWMQVAANSLFLATLGVRPMMDVLWTNEHQPGNPYHRDRPNVLHDAIFTTLSTGPFGIGDMLGDTNASLVAAATRADGIILKPAAAALRVDRFYNVPLPSPSPSPPPSPPGPPWEVGCSDGTCEAFCTLNNVRGCAARWPGSKHMRSPPTGVACGGEVPCLSPADSCGPGWGVCMSFGRGAGLDTGGFMAGMNYSHCSSETGAYVAAQSHAPTTANSARGCTHNASDDFTCKVSGYGSEPLCCGAKCTVPSCSKALWPEHTRALLHNGPCAAVIGDDDAFDGVLCCRVEPLTPGVREIEGGQRDTSAARFEITAAPSAPGDHWPSPDATDNRMSLISDSRAWSLPDIDRAEAVWWWSVLATNVDAGEGAAPLRLAELFPLPPADTVFFVHEFGSPACVHNQTVTDCLTTWTSMQPLPVATGVGKFPDRKFKLLRAAPRLSSGWTLVGETSKFVSVSPQRLTVRSSRAHASKSRTEGDLLSDVDGLSFTVLGAAGEEVRLTVVSPDGLVVVVSVTIGSEGAEDVVCRIQTCVAGAMHG